MVLADGSTLVPVLIAIWVISGYIGAGILIFKGRWGGLRDSANIIWPGFQILFPALMGSILFLIALAVQQKKSWTTVTVDAPITIRAGDKAQIGIGRGITQVQNIDSPNSPTYIQVNLQDQQYLRELNQALGELAKAIYTSNGLNPQQRQNLLQGVEEAHQELQPGNRNADRLKGIIGGIYKAAKIAGAAGTVLTVFEQYAHVLGGFIH